MRKIMKKVEEVKSDERMRECDMYVLFSCTYVQTYEYESERVEERKREGPDKALLKRQEYEQG